MLATALGTPSMTSSHPPCSLIGVGARAGPREASCSCPCALPGTSGGNTLRWEESNSISSLYSGHPCPTVYRRPMRMRTRTSFSCLKVTAYGFHPVLVVPEVRGRLLCGPFQGERRWAHESMLPWPDLVKTPGLGQVPRNCYVSLRALPSSALFPPHRMRTPVVFFPPRPRSKSLQVPVAVGVSLHRRRMTWESPPTLRPCLSGWEAGILSRCWGTTSELDHIGLLKTLFHCFWDEFTRTLRSDTTWCYRNRRTLSNV